MSSKTQTIAMKEEVTPALVPKLRFPAFRDAEGWEEKQLGDLCKIRTGKKDANEGSPDGEYPFFTCAEKHIYSRTYSFDAEAILVAGNANVGQTKYYNGKFEAYQRTYVLTDFSGISVPYLYAILNANLRESLLGQVQTSAMSYIKLPMLEEYVLPVPPTKPEQQKIAECLSSVDELMAAQARKVDALKTHKKWLMQQLFPREGETQPRLRFPEFQNAGEWEVIELGRLSDVRDGTHDSPAFFQTGRPLVTSKNLRPDGTLDLENVSLISDEDYEQINKRSKVTVGDILFGMIGTIGNPVLIKSEGFAIKNVALIKELGPLSNAFLVQLLQSGYVAAIFAMLNTGNSQKFIALGKIRGLPIPVPSLPEQQCIASCLSSLDALITAETQKHDALKTHKKGLMQQLFPSPEEVEA